MSNKNLIKATHQGILNINGIKITCAVLEDGTRVISEKSVANALGSFGSGGYWKKRKLGKGANLPRYLYANFLSPFISQELKENLSNALKYEAINKKESSGLKAEFLPEICHVWIKANEKGAVPENTKIIAETAYILLKGFATVGIIALVDEATGYQWDREKNELQLILKSYISEEILEWQKTFQLSFYKEIFKLWDIPFTAENIKKKPLFIGKLTNELVYKNLPKGTFVLDKLKKKTPKTSEGNYKYRLHQSLTKDIGREALIKVLHSVETLASISKDKRHFKKLMNEKYGQTEIQFDDLEDKAETKKIDNPTPFDKTLKGLLSVPAPKK